MTEFIVAEVSKNYVGEWPAGKQYCAADSLCGRFEHVIEHNRQRGYVLHSFQLHRLMTGKDVLNETIIAVFQRKET